MFENKINVMEGNWLDKRYYNTILPQLQEEGIESAVEEIIPLTRLYDDSYWGSLRSIHRIDLALVDPMLLHASDAEFHQYARKLSTINFPAICIFQDPYGFERPKEIDIDAFERKLFERTKVLCQLIKAKNPDTIIVSPAINDIKEHRERYMDFFTHNRSLFDVYAVHCCNDMKEHSLARVTSLLSEVLSVLSKEVWITKWAIPCLERRLTNTGFMNWSPITYMVACQRLRHSFVIIESITKGKSKWFYSGMGIDAFGVNLRAGSHEYWNPLSSAFIPSEYSPTWDFYHFIGMMTDRGDIKDPLFESFIKLANSQNR